MKKRTKIILAISTFVFILFIGAIAADFLLAKIYEKVPIFAIEKRFEREQYTVYYSLFFKVYECDSEEVIVKGYNKKAPVCPKIVRFEEEYFTNWNGLKISKRDYEAVRTSYNYEIIDDWKTEEELKEAVYVGEGFHKSFFCGVDIKANANGEEASVVAFNDLIEDEYGNYSWECMKDEESYYYCAKIDQNNEKFLFSEYENGNCISEWKPLEIEDKWCNLVKENKNINFRELILQANWCN